MIVDEENYNRTLTEKYMKTQGDKRGQGLLFMDDLERRS